LAVQFIICYIIEIPLTIPEELEEKLNNALIKEKDKNNINKA